MPSFRSAPQGDPIRVGLIGYGYAGKTFHAPLIAAVPGLQLTRVYSSNPEKVLVDWPSVHVTSALEDVLGSSEVDLVVVASPTDQHFGNARAALEAQKHVVIDKPFASNYADAQDLADLAQARGRYLGVFHNRRWDADFLTVRNLICKGTLGEVLTYESHFDRYRPIPQHRWREKAGEGGGIWLDLGPHLLDQACVLFGLPDSIYADLSCQRQTAEAVDYFHVLLSYLGGRQKVILHAGCIVATESPRFCLHGELGSYLKLGLDTQEAALKRGELPGSPGWGDDPRDGILTLPTGSSPLTTIAGDYRAFYVVVRELLYGRADNGAGADPLAKAVSVTDSLNVMALLELGQQSAREGRVIPVSLESGRWQELCRAK